VSISVKATVSRVTDTLNTVAALAAVAISVVGAVIALLARRDSKRAAKAAEDTVTLERDRRHGELTPTLTSSATVRHLGHGFGDSRIWLTLRLDGPAGLTCLDTVMIRIRDDQPRTPITAGGPTQQQLDQVIWGPYHLVPHVDGTDALGRTAKAHEMRPGDERHWELKPSQLPGWMTDQQAWAEQYRGAPIRLEVECVRNGYPRWTVLIEAAQPTPKFAADATPRSAGAALTFRNVGTAPARQPTITTNHPDDDPTLTGTYRDVIEPDQSTQTVVITNTAGHMYEWARLSWVDPRGANDDLRVNLRF
jgi:hypothetical protein